MNAQTPRYRMLGAALALAALCACKGDPGEEDPPPPPPPAGFSLQVSGDKVAVLQGSSGTFTVNVVRETNFTGAVDLAVSGLPTGVSTATASVASSATSAQLKLDAAANAPHSLPTAVTVNGTSGDKSASGSVTVTVRGPAGALDTSFGGGSVRTAVGTTDDYAEAVAVQADAKILVVGRGATTSGTDFAVVRYERDGSLDTGFGTGGKVMTPVGAASDEAYAVAVQGDGKILVAGSGDGGASGMDFALVRYNSNGSLDTGFGTGGKVLTAFGTGPDRAYAIRVQADGKIVLGGETNTGTTGLDFAVARYNADGSLDTGFGTGGKVITAIKAGAGRDTIFALALQTVGGETRIVAAGGDGDFIMARYTANGNLDSSFGTGGKISGLFASSVGSARAVAVTSQGKIVVAGHNNNDFAVAQLLEAGGLDSGFGTGGKTVTRLSTTNSDEATSLVLQEDGKILVGGWVNTGAGTSADFALVRYDAAGALDSGFGTGGQVVTQVAGAKNDKASSMVLQVDERVPGVRALLVGSAVDSNHDFAVTRFWL